jgi:hypothetical protein
MEIHVMGGVEKIGFNNPTAFAAVAIGGLCMAKLQMPEGRRLAKSFQDAGGIAAVVQLLKKPTCPVTLQYIASSIGIMLNWRMGLHLESHGLSPDPAESFLEAGERVKVARG